METALGLRFAKASRRWTSRCLVDNVYSIAGSDESPNLAYWVTVQPFITLHLPATFFLSSDAEMDFYWHGGKSTVPVDLGLGRAFSERFIGALRLYYTVAEANRGTFKVLAFLNFQR